MARALPFLPAGCRNRHGKDDSTASLIVRRRDKPYEIFLLLRSVCRLGDVVPVLG